MWRYSSLRPLLPNILAIISQMYIYACYVIFGNPVCMNSLRHWLPTYHPLYQQYLETQLFVLSGPAYHLVSCHSKFSFNPLPACGCGLPASRMAVDRKFQVSVFISTCWVHIILLPLFYFLPHWVTWVAAVSTVLGEKKTLYTVVCFLTTLPHLGTENGTWIIFAQHGGFPLSTYVFCFFNKLTALLENCVSPKTRQGFTAACLTDQGSCLLLC